MFASVTPSDRILEKLNRSYENVLNLEVEIDKFFQNSKYPVLCDENLKPIPEAIEYHLKLPIPPRFSVLAGEIIHHLRSCLDHLVWHFSDPKYRTANEKFIEFPILEERPSERAKFGKWKRKIGGIRNAYILDRIEKLQPYHCGVASESQLHVLHNLDRIDKHRDLLIVAASGAAVFPPNLLRRLVSHEYSTPENDTAYIAREFRRDGQIVPQVAFGESYWGKPQIVVQGLTILHDYIVGLCKEFTARLP